jgi:hypothetical protein
MLLHSKLSSKEWPVPKQMVQRLFECLPRCLVSVKVHAPTLQPMADFTVELMQLESAEKGSGGEDRRVHMVVQGKHGECNIRGVPLQMTFLLRVYHSTMRMQSAKFVTKDLQMRYSFGADVVFCLWVSRMVGGLSLSASVADMDPESFPMPVQPFDGPVTVDDATLRVRGVIRMPWSEFDPSMMVPPSPLRGVRCFHLDGYHPAAPSRLALDSTMESLHQNGFIEVCRLQAPVVRLQIALPGGLPLPGVRVTVAAEQQVAVSDSQGECQLALPPGEHCLRLEHSGLLTGAPTVSSRLKP